MPTYSCGREAKCGDVVRCVDGGSQKYVVNGCEYCVNEVETHHVLVDNKGWFEISRFELIRRQEEPMPDPKTEPLVKWPEERQETYAELRPYELFVFVDHPQVVLRRLKHGGAVVIVGTDQFDSYEPAAYEPNRKIRRVKVLAMPQFEVI